MYNLGRYNNLEIVREVDFGFYLSDDEGNEILLPRKQVGSDTFPGDMIDVFVYNDSEDRVIATTNKPLGCVGDVVALKVVDVNKFGAFLNWGLEKDLFLPFKHQKRRISLHVDDMVLVKIMHDIISNRLIASMRIMTEFDADKAELNIGDAVSFQIVEEHDHGLLVIINDLYQGLLFSDDISESIYVGDKRNGFIKNIRPDEKITVSLKPVGVKAVSSDRELILDRLNSSSTNSLMLNSSSSPEEILRTLDMSKKAFKKAIGGLYKDRVIILTKDGIELKEKA